MVPDQAGLNICWITTASRTSRREPGATALVGCSAWPTCRKQPPCGARTGKKTPAEGMTSGDQFLLQRWLPGWRLISSGRAPQCPMMPWRLISRESHEISWEFRPMSLKGLMFSVRSP